MMELLRNMTMQCSVIDLSAPKESNQQPVSNLSSISKILCPNNFFSLNLLVVLLLEVEDCWGSFPPASSAPCGCPPASCPRAPAGTRREENNYMIAIFA